MFEKKYFVYWFLKRGEGRETGRETAIGCLSQVVQLGTELTTSRFADDTQTSHTSQGSSFNNFKNNSSGYNVPGLKFLLSLVSGRLSSRPEAFLQHESARDTKPLDQSCIIKLGLAPNSAQRILLQQNEKNLPLLSFQLCSLQAAGAESTG